MGDKPQAFGITAEFKVVSFLFGKEIERMPILWARPNKVMVKIKVPVGEFPVDSIVYRDLPSTVLVEPTEHELNFRKETNSVLSPTSNRYILLHCTNVFNCNFKHVVNMVFNPDTGGWALSQSGGLEGGCPKCKSTLYSCGKSIISSAMEFNGLVKCRCIHEFNTLNFNISIPKTKSK